MDFIFSASFQQSDKILLDLCIFTGFENVVLMIGLDRSSLACIDTKHRTRYS